MDFRKNKHFRFNPLCKILQPTS